MIVYSNYLYDPGKLEQVAPFWQPKSVPLNLTHSSTSISHVGPFKSAMIIYLNVKAVKIRYNSLTRI